MFWHLFWAWIPKFYCPNLTLYPTIFSENFGIGLPSAHKDIESKFVRWRDSDGRGQCKTRWLSHPSLLSPYHLTSDHLLVRDSVEGWREAVLALDAFLGWKQVLNRSGSCLMSAWQEWHPAAIAGTITAVFLTVWYTGLMLQEVNLYLYDCPLSRSQSTDTAGYYWTYSHPGRFHRTKGYIFTRSISKNMNFLSDLGQDF